MRAQHSSEPTFPGTQQYNPHRNNKSTDKEIIQDDENCWVNVV